MLDFFFPPHQVSKIGSGLFCPFTNIIYSHIAWLTSSSPSVFSYLKYGAGQMRTSHNISTSELCQGGFLIFQQQLRSSSSSSSCLFDLSYELHTVSLRVICSTSFQSLVFVFLHLHLGSSFQMCI